MILRLFLTFSYEQLKLCLYTADCVRMGAIKYNQMQ